MEPFNLKKIRSKQREYQTEEIILTSASLFSAEKIAQSVHILDSIKPIIR